MGFLSWSLWGMGLSGLGALILLGIALLLGSPRTQRRMGWTGAATNKRLTALTGYAFALLLLAFGFFLAGVPLQQPAGSAQVIEVVITTTPAPIVNQASREEPSQPPTPTLTRSPTGSMSGAFEMPLADLEQTRPVTATLVAAVPPEAREEDTESNETIPATASSTMVPDATATATPTARPTMSPTATPTPSPTASATSTPSPTATATSTPTKTATPITDPVAAIDTQGSTLWVRRSPGGAPVILVNDEDIVILLSRQANQGGLLWQEIQVVSGEVGWVQSMYLDFNPQ